MFCLNRFRLRVVGQSYLSAKKPLDCCGCGNLLRGLFCAASQASEAQLAVLSCRLFSAQSAPSLSFMWAPFSVALPGTSSQQIFSQSRL